MAVAHLQLHKWRCSTSHRAHMGVAKLTLEYHSRLLKVANRACFWKVLKQLRVVCVSNRKVGQCVKWMLVIFLLDGPYLLCIAHSVETDK